MSDEEYDLTRYSHPTCVLCVETTDDVSAEDWHSIVLSLDEVFEWWNFFPGFYVLKLNSDTETLKDVLTERSTGRYFLSEVVGSAWGRLPFNEWKFFLDLDQSEIRKIEANIHKKVVKGEDKE